MLWDLPLILAKNFHGHIAEGVIVILLVFAFFLYLLIKQKRLHPAATGLLITIGICFTFYGISKGLANFDANDIEQNLPQLIEGIKTAFLVSVVAVFFAIVLKIIAIVIEFTQKEQESSGADIDDIVNLQQKMLEKKEQGLKFLDENTKATNALNDNIKLLRLDNEKGFESLKSSFEEFAKTMAENNSKAFIQALEEVIKDFNNKITEQFGDNFKQLNLAVGALLTWQDNYKAYIETNQEKLSELLALLDKTTLNYQSVVESSKAFSEHASALHTLLNELVNQRQDIEENIKSLALFLEQNQKLIPELLSSITQFASKGDEVFNTMSQKAQALEEHFSSTSTKLMQNVSENINKFNDELRGHNDKINTQLIETLNNASTSINAQIKVLDTELENVLKNLSSNLASISTKFVDDYNIIISNLSSLVNRLGHLK